MSKFGTNEGYVSKECEECGRVRVEHYSSGIDVCEKCRWSPQLGRFVTDEEFYEDDIGKEEEWFGKKNKMETLDIVIRISEKHYNIITDDIKLSEEEYPILHQRIAEGVVLPKGHGDLISKQEISDYVKSYIHEIISESGRDLNEHTNRVLRSIIEHLNEAEAVVEADKEGAAEC